MENNDSKRIKPTKLWYLFSIFLFFLGPIIGAYLLYSTFTAAIHTVSFVIPGTSQIYIIAPGEYTLWTESKLPGGLDKISNDLQNSRLTITETATKKSLIFLPKVGWNDSKNHISHYSLGTLSLQNAGTYQINAASNSTVPYKVYLRKPSLLAMMKALALASILTILSIVTGVLLAIIILIKRINARNFMQNNEQKPTPTSPQPITSQATTWAMVCHLSGFAGFLFPFANIIAPLLIWGFKRQEFPYLDEQGKEAINFQISISIYYVIAAVLILIVIGLFLLPLLAAFQIIAMIIASIESAHAKPFRYPLTIRFLR